MSKASKEDIISIIAMAAIAIIAIIITVAITAISDPVSTTTPDPIVWESTCNDIHIVSRKNPDTGYEYTELYADDEYIGIFHN